MNFPEVRSSSKSLDNYGYILVADTMEEVIDIANEIASEHLEIHDKESV